MCIVFYTVSHPGFRLVMAANRDEFYDRPAAPAEWHNFDSPDNDDKWVLCGRDLGSPEKGTWLGMTRDLRVGILLNIRYPLTPPPPNPPSRGHLLKAFLGAPPAQAPSVQSYLGDIDASRYVGFNLLLLRVHKNDTDVGYITNRPEPTQLDLHTRDRGCTGISNSPLAEPYPKVVQGEESMRNKLGEWDAKKGTDDELVESMMDLLSPSQPIHKAEDMMRSTLVAPFLVGKEPARVDLNFSSEHGRWYGTRLSTVIIVKDNGDVIFVERDRALQQNGQIVNGTGERRVQFRAELS